MREKKNTTDIGFPRLQPQNHTACSRILSVVTILYRNSMGLSIPGGDRLAIRKVDE